MLPVRALIYLFPSRDLATPTELRQRQWQQNTTVPGEEEDDSNKVRRAPSEVGDGTDVRARDGASRDALLSVKRRPSNSFTVNFI
ncbi:unnamed protein product [Menidia menidia]|uniref:(Atlantic silverside) hypothetical protein n=1 Tax=Menidia menidia TaxID=238744 RepID=A0A8S4AQM2_9TELE|nr:unnamed protein product [Menidia menidia]